jgi:hypothetical protein
MTPSDDLWAEPTRLDTEFADLGWDGTPPPDATPELSHDVRTVIDTARGPGEPDELNNEHEIVDAMRAAALRVAHLEPRRRRRTGFVGRVVAVKGVAAVGVIAFGVATAAAATGIVASILLPGTDGGPSPGRPSTTSVTNGDSSDQAPAEQDPQRDRPTVNCEADATCPQEPGQQSSLPTTKPDGAPARGNGDGHGNGNAETPAPPAGDTNSQNPTRPGSGHDPAQGHGPPSDPGPPGQPGQGGTPPGQDEAATHAPGPPTGPAGQHPPPPDARPPVGPPHPSPLGPPVAPAGQPAPSPPLGL